MIDIVSAEAGSALDEFITLSREYVTWMVAEIRVRYPQLDINEFTAEHEYEDLRTKFPGEHVAPDGCLLIALNDGKACGCIALGRLDETTCEMRTLFVRPEFRSLGAARRLVNTVFNKARQYGYDTMRLDTLGFMDGAQRLYQSFGFYMIAPYLEMSESLKQYIRFFECKLPA